MTMAIMSLLLNFLIVVLLMATISYCWVLNKRIKILQDGRNELASLLNHFDESTTKASETILALQSASKKIGENIQAKIDKVNYLIDDLAFMVEKGNHLADKLEANFAVNRARNKVDTEKNIDVIPEAGHSETEKNISVKGAPVAEDNNIVKTPEKISSKEKTTASLEAVLDRVISRAKPNANTGNNPNNISAKSGERDNHAKAKGNNVPRSKVEQELLDMIRAGVKG